MRLDYELFRRTRAKVGVAAIALGSCVPAVGAQQPFTPGVAFGASVYPLIEVNADGWALQFDLFTELSKDLFPYPTQPWSTFERYNDIDRTIGFNQLGFSRLRTGSFGGPFAWHLNGWASGGVVWDAPTEFLQNDFAHGLRLLTFVPREGTHDHIVLGVGGQGAASAAWVLASSLDIVGFAGVGFGASTSFMDGYVLGGTELNIWVLSLGGLLRFGASGDPFPGWDMLYLGLADSYRLKQVWVVLPSIWTWFPRLRVTFSDSRGPFTKSGGLYKQREQLWSFRLETNRGEWAVEMWNDLGFKDLGPTFGLKIQWF